MRQCHRDQERTTSCLVAHPQSGRINNNMSAWRHEGRELTADVRQTKQE